MDKREIVKKLNKHDLLIKENYIVEPDGEIEIAKVDKYLLTSNNLGTDLNPYYEVYMVTKDINHIIIILEDNRLLDRLLLEHNSK